ncbi:MAG: histidine kinase [Lewinellaceae bacterium]|nr:histidine kinase [Lewinellaceae bacterium]
MELNALRAQMNPHFIFNCLNSIDYYILKNDTDKASDYLNRFSRLIQLIPQNSRSEYVNLKDELESLRLYIEMESLRFERPVRLRSKNKPGLRIEDIEIPPMLPAALCGECHLAYYWCIKKASTTWTLPFTRQNGACIA